MAGAARASISASYAVEPLRSRAARLIDRAFALHGVAHLGALLRLLPERDPQGELFEMAEVIADRLDLLDLAPTLMARFELALLQALGFGLDLERCALTGATDDLAYRLAQDRPRGHARRGRALERPAAALSRLPAGRPPRAGRCDRARGGLPPDRAFPDARRVRAARARGAAGALALCGRGRERLSRHGVSLQTMRRSRWLTP